MFLSACMIIDSVSHVKYTLVATYREVNPTLILQIHTPSRGNLIVVVGQVSSCDTGKAICAKRSGMRTSGAAPPFFILLANGLSPTLTFMFLQLTKFPRRLAMNTGQTARWLYLLNCVCGVALIGSAFACSFLSVQLAIEKLQKELSTLDDRKKAVQAVQKLKQKQIALIMQSVADVQATVDEVRTV